MLHIPVLLQPVLEVLHVKPSGVYLDLTGGYGGHSEEILKKISDGQLIVADQDLQAIECLKNKFGHDPRVTIIHAAASQVLKQMLHEKKNFDGILADIGVSSVQLDTPERGFSFLNDGPLDMRMNREDPVDAAEIINKYSEKELADIIYYYGEERASRKIAKDIVEARREKKIETTKELADLIKKSVGGFYRNQKIHPATRTFQGLRIAVNNELDELKAILETAPEVLKEKGRLAIISFHSLEDRLVKKKFVELKEKGWTAITKKPLIADDAEIEKNSRSRSAKLRGVERN